MHDCYARYHYINSIKVSCPNTKSPKSVEIEKKTEQMVTIQKSMFKKRTLSIGKHCQHTVDT